MFIDKPGGVTHDDCSEVSRQIDTVLDVEDFIHSAYTLEVSSPGLERGLYKLADYERFVGSVAKMIEDGATHIWIGRRKDTTTIEDSAGIDFDYLLTP